MAKPNELILKNPKSSFVAGLCNRQVAGLCCSLSIQFNRLGLGATDWI